MYIQLFDSMAHVRSLRSLNKMSRYLNLDISLPDILESVIDFEQTPIELFLSNSCSVKIESCSALSLHKLLSSLYSLYIKTADFDLCFIDT
jgi:hypothetical protein